MPWSATDAEKHTKAVRRGGPKAARQWAHVANGAVAEGRSEGDAVMMANGVAKKRAEGGYASEGTGNPYRKGLRGVGI